ncbi:hypothetical protein BH09ACT6_BH09ACT6_11010 [soil metagenome]
MLGIALCGLLAIQALRRQVRRRREDRLRALAASNGLDYSPISEWLEASALINGAANRRIIDEFCGTDAAGTVRLGTLSFNVERASVQITESWSFLAQTVPGAPLPHILLLSQNESGRSLPASLDPRQKMLLEGDFPKYFDIYCSPGAERDALYILTPDLMASLADNAGFSSLEIIDNTVLFFTPGRFDPEDPAQWRRSLRMLSSVGADTLKRVRRFNRSQYSNSTRTQQHQPDSASSARKRLVTSLGRSNRSTQIVEATCAAVVAAAFVWASLR